MAPWLTRLQMETEQEKVVPFHKPIVDVDEDGEGAQVGGKVKDGSTVPGGDGQITEGKVWLCAYGTDEAGGELEEWDYFHRFHQRFNKVCDCSSGYALILVDSWPRKTKASTAIVRTYLKLIVMNL